MSDDARAEALATLRDLAREPVTVPERDRPSS